MGRNDLEDIAILVGLGIVGVMAYKKFFPGKSAEEVFKELDTGMRAFLDTIKLPALPPLPQIQFPVAQAQQTPLPPASSSIPNPTSPAAPATNTVPDPGEPQVKGPENKPAGSGQVDGNPQIPAPPAGSGGAIVAFAGDFDSKSTGKQTVDVMEKNNVSFIIGCGDYSYGPAAETWFNNTIGARYKGKMKGALGNHDNNSYLSVFGQTKWNFTHKVAPNLTVVFIDTEKGIDEATLTTLTKAAKAESKHVVYCFHKPYITSSNHKGSDNKSGPVIDKVAKANGIKLIVAGHNHCYEHFICDGVHFVTAGASGRKFYGTKCAACTPVKCTDNTYGFLKVAVGNTLRCQFVTHQNTAYDTFDVV